MDLAVFLFIVGGISFFFAFLAFLSDHVFAKINWDLLYGRLRRKLRKLTK